MKSRYSEGEYNAAQIIMCKNQLGISIEHEGDMRPYGNFMRNKQMAEANNIIFWKEMEEDEAAFRKKRGL